MKWQGTVRCLLCDLVAKVTLRHTLGAYAIPRIEIDAWPVAWWRHRDYQTLVCPYYYPDMFKRFLNDSPSQRFIKHPEYERNP